MVLNFLVVFEKSHLITVNHFNIHRCYKRKVATIYERKFHFFHLVIKVISQSWRPVWNTSSERTTVVCKWVLKIQLMVWQTLPATTHCKTLFERAFCRTEWRSDHVTIDGLISILSNFKLKGIVCSEWAQYFNIKESAINFDQQFKRKNDWHLVPETNMWASHSKYRWLQLHQKIFFRNPKSRTSFEGIALSIKTEHNNSFFKLTGCFSEDTVI